MADSDQHKFKVFISHSTLDKFMARKIDEMLQAIGIATFRDDRDLDAGDPIPEEIRHEIASSDELLVLWTTQTLASEWVKQEIGAAWGLGLKTVALLHVVEASTLPPNIRNCLAYPINDAERYLEEVSRRAETQ